MADDDGTHALKTYAQLMAAETVVGYLRDAFSAQRTIVRRARRALKDIEYDTIVCTGVSGAVVAPVLAYLGDKNLFVVRKEKGGHSSSMTEGILGDKWIFVDDQVSTGETRLRVRNEVGRVIRLNKLKCEYVGTYLYVSNVFY